MVPLSRSSLIDMPEDPLLQPFQLKHLTLRNRVISTSHAPSFDDKGHPKERYRLYHEEKARGGIGLTMIGGSTNIALDSPSVFGQLYAGDDSIIPWFKKLTAGVKQHGASVMCQITHMGRRTAWDNAHWLPVLAPSKVREHAHRATPKSMEVEDIDRVVSQFAQAALRCQLGGFDGIEILSHSHLLGQFLSPVVNRRTDDYGGSLDNRLRFSKRVFSAIRLAVGPEFIVGVRLTGDEMIEYGADAEDCLEIAKALSATGHIDFINVLAGAPYDDLGLATWVPPMGQPSAAHLSVASRIRNCVDIPILHAGGISDLASARHAISAGHVDLVGMTRAHLADPHLISKLKEGNELRIRPCVGLGYCVDRVNQGKDAVCGHNPVTGRESMLPHIIKPARSSKNVIIIGAGPAGMEAARVCAERGHKTTLFEASEELGGQLKLASKGATRQQLIGVCDWLKGELEHLNVDVRLNQYAEASDVLSLAPNLVVIATGGWPTPPDIHGAEHVVSSWDVLVGEERLSGEIILIDEMGDHASAVCANVLLEQGCSVTMITPDRMMAQELGPTNSSVVLRDLIHKGLKFSCLQKLHSVSLSETRKSVALQHVLTQQIEYQTVDHIVIENGTTPMDDIYHQLKPYSLNLGQLNQTKFIEAQNAFDMSNTEGQFFLARIGDAIAGRNIHAALYDAIRLCVRW